MLEFTIDDSTLDGHTAANYNPIATLKARWYQVSSERESQAHTLSSAESNTHGS